MSVYVLSTHVRTMSRRSQVRSMSLKNRDVLPLRLLRDLVLIVAYDALCAKNLNIRMQ